MEGLGSSPSLKIGGFQSGPSLENEGDFRTKINKRIFFKRGVFWSIPGRKNEQTNVYFLKGGSFEAVQVKKSGVFKMGGFREAYTCTALIWEYTSPPPHLLEPLNINSW